MTDTSGTSDGMDWAVKPGNLMPFDMVMPAAEVTVSPELLMKSIDVLAGYLDERYPDELRLQAASSIIMHHARRRAL